MTALERLIRGEISPELKAKLEKATRALEPVTPSPLSRREGQVDLGSQPRSEAGLRARIPVLAGSYSPITLPSRDGVKPITRIKMKHRRMVALHIEGLSHTEIAKIIGCSPATVSTVIHNPTIKPILARIYAEFDDLILGLKPLVYEALRKVLRDGSSDMKLKAIDRWGKITGEFKDTSDPGQTAEEVVKMLLKVRHENSDGSATEIVVGGQVT